MILMIIQKVPFKRNKNSSLESTLIKCKIKLKNIE